MPSAQAPTTVATTLDDDVGEEADRHGLLQGWPPLAPARTTQAATALQHRALPHLSARINQWPYAPMLPGSLRPHAGGLLEDRDRRGNRLAADDYRGYEPP
jgi:hypothetical protein